MDISSKLSISARFGIVLIEDDTLLIGQFQILFLLIAAFNLKNVNNTYLNSMSDFSERAHNIQCLSNPTGYTVSASLDADQLFILS